MWTRSGAIDPTVVTYLQKVEGLSADEVEKLLNKESGLQGVSGVGSDCRDIREAAANGDYRAKLSMKILCHNIKKIIGSYVAEMNGVDAVVFTAGIGENDARVRSEVCADMEFLGVKMDEDKNLNYRDLPVPADVSAPDSKVRILVIATNEELVIARDTAEVVEALNK
jgi:acetate kinase